MAAKSSLDRRIKTLMMHQLRHYFALHAQNLFGAMGQVARQPVGSLMTIVVIAIALALPAGLRVLMNNVQVLSGSWRARSTSLFISRWM